VPEPEIALYVNPQGRIIGYTIGNDMSSRDIEGENPLYLPQAKIYDGACALGPALLVTETLPSDTTISLRVRRHDTIVLEAQTEWTRMKREPRELIAFLYAELSFPNGCVLLTGTGIVPPDDFSLAARDIVEITVPAIGTLRNVVGE
jgi:2-dehydro-3-deoxy-D-arabinonate dehydratase